MSYLVLLYGKSNKNTIMKPRNCR